tara:strand:+ start:804 stop:929 length:126 start_codon:yes stop_codon:yes gene_type:complete
MDGDEAEELINLIRELKEALEDVRELMRVEGLQEETKQSVK